MNVSKQEMKSVCVDEFSLARLIEQCKESNTQYGSFDVQQIEIICKMAFLYWEQVESAGTVDLQSPGTSANSDGLLRALEQALCFGDLEFALDDCEGARMLKAKYPDLAEYLRTRSEARTAEPSEPLPTTTIALTVSEDCSQETIEALVECAKQVSVSSDGGER